MVTRILTVSVGQTQSYTPERQAIVNQLKTTALTAANNEFRDINLDYVEHSIKNLMQTLAIKNLTQDQNKIYQHLQFWIHQLNLTIKSIQKEFTVAGTSSANGLYAAFIHVATDIKYDIKHKTFMNPAENKKLDPGALKPVFKEIRRIEKECIDTIIRNLPKQAPVLSRRPAFKPINPSPQAAD